MSKLIGLKISETDLAQQVVAWLDTNKWEVFQEVRLFHSGDPIADIVARRGKCIWIIECKTSFNADVIAQSYNWIHHAHMRSIAYPKEKRDRTGTFLKQVAEHYGIGSIIVNSFKNFDTEGYTSTVTYRPGEFEKHPHFADKVSAALKPEHQSWSKAGSRGGGYYTPFKDTCQQVVAYVREHPGCTIKEMMSGVKHHYKSYRGACVQVGKFIEEGVINGIYFRKEGKELKYYPKI